MFTVKPSLLYAVVRFGEGEAPCRILCLHSSSALPIIIIILFIIVVFTWFDHQLFNEAGNVLLVCLPIKHLFGRFCLKKNKVTSC
ncbi:hypothetical protein IscW_ISCW000341 [Ixodes scapularis]|uniref:Uncharacterized protein n=1 Tax=Ixodes scapularis TaxID=6945 RepID=B7P4B5_IXOSC|nr:hypothetical protein IscW_ISCW000341 [Ixodes scapularis]|eukprot:XP_002405766.1 hypothetical protein IscW_ISCW000341 [Ixodes scapularis]